MSVIDLDEYPDRTVEILMALWEHEQKYKHDELQSHKMKRRMLASRTSLNKQQVRYRLKQLVEDGYVTEDVIPEHNQRVAIYALPPDGKESARAIGEAKDVLGEIPEEIGRQDLLKLTSEMAAIRAEIEVAGFDINNIESSKLKQELDQCERSIKYNYDEIELHEKDIQNLWKGVDRIYEEFGWDKIEYE